MNTLQGVSGKDGDDERIASAFNRLYGKTKQETKKAGKIPGPAYRLICCKGFRAFEVSRQKQYFSME